MTRPDRLAALTFALLLLVAVPVAAAESAPVPDQCSAEHPGNGNGHAKKCEEAPTEEPSDNDGSEEATDNSGSGRAHPHGTPPGQNKQDPPGSSGAPPAPTPGETPGPPADGTLEVTVTATPDLATVGDEISYEIVATNLGELPGPVTIRNEVPSELDVTSTTGTPAVEDGTITWTIDHLEAGAVSTFGWTGTVAREGDLIATNTVTLTGVDVDPVVTETYLAVVKGIQITRSEGEQDWGTHKERRVVLRAAPGTSTDVAGGQVLPLTGFPALELAFAGLLLTLGGAVLVARKKRAAAVAMLVVLAAAACTSEAPPPVATPETSEVTPTPEPTDDVLGTRFDRKNQNNNKVATTDPGDQDADSTTDEDDGDDATTEPATEPVPEPEPEMVREVVVVEVANAAPKPDTLGATHGMNTVSLTWNEPQRAIETALSSRRFDAGSPVDLVASVTDGGDALVATATLTNISTDQRLDVDGHLVIEVSGSAGSFELTSPAIDQVLDPGAEVTTSFTIVVASGDYTIESAFRPN